MRTTIALPLDCQSRYTLKKGGPPRYRNNPIQVTEGKQAVVSTVDRHTSRLRHVGKRTALTSCICVLAREGEGGGAALKERSARHWRHCHRRAQGRTTFERGPLRMTGPRIGKHRLLSSAEGGVKGHRLQLTNRHRQEVLQH